MALDNIKDLNFIQSHYRQHRNLLFSISFNILKEKELSEDAVQETVKHLMLDIRKTDNMSEEQIRGYMATICRNISINMYNKRKRSCEYDEELTGVKLADRGKEMSEVLPVILKQETADELIKIIKDLDPIYREIIILKYSRGLKTSEIAEMKKIKYETVKKQLTRARKKIIEEMKRRYGYGEE